MKTTLGAPAPLGGFSSKRGGGVALRASTSVIGGCCGSGRGKIARSGTLRGVSLMDRLPHPHVDREDHVVYASGLGARTPFLATAVICRNTNLDQLAPIASESS